MVIVQEEHGILITKEAQSCLAMVQLVSQRYLQPSVVKLNGCVFPQ